MKKFFALNLAGAMLLSMAACGKNEVVEDNSDVQKEDIIIIQGAAGEETFGVSITSGNTIEITSYSGSYDLHPVTIPDEIDGRPVTAIGESAFYHANNITEIKIPATVTSIGDWAFAGCNYLTSVTGSDAVTTIGKDAFAQCPALKTVQFSSVLTEIEAYAFKGCSSLASATFTAKLTAIGDAAFEGAGLTSVSIPESVKSIGLLSFNGCTALASVTLTAGTTEIGDFSFNGCAKNLVISCPAGSAAAAYAAEAGIATK